MSNLQDELKNFDKDARGQRAEARGKRKEDVGLLTPALFRKHIKSGKDLVLDYGRQPSRPPCWRSTRGSPIRPALSGLPVSWATCSPSTSSATCPAPSSSPPPATVRRPSRIMSVRCSASTICTVTRHRKPSPPSAIQSTPNGTALLNSMRLSVQAGNTSFP